MSRRRYCLIAPCRDEERFARRTLNAIVNQTELPQLVVIVDDGSTDSTPAILAEFAARYSFIRVVRCQDRGHRRVGGGVVDAFYAGYATIDPGQYDYICKVDLDLDFPAWYFAEVMDRMEREPRLGTFSGKPYFARPGTDLASVKVPLVDDPRLVSEKSGDENSVGMAKFYRTRCFREIGGFVREVMWDGIDGHRCRQRGWMTASVDDPMLRVLHLRPMGSSHRSWWAGRLRHGFGQYFMGTTPVYMIASAIYRMSRPPLVVGGIGMLVGYFRSMFRGDARYGDLEFRRFLRRYQWACLFMGKKRATRALEARQAARWTPDREAASGASSDLAAGPSNAGGAGAAGDVASRGA